MSHRQIGVVTKIESEAIVLRRLSTRASGLAVCVDVSHYVLDGASYHLLQGRRL